MPPGDKPRPDDAIWPVELQDRDAFKRRGQIRDFKTAKDDEAVNGDFFSFKELHSFNPKVVDALIRCYKYWIAVADIDGYRIDTVRNVEPKFCSTFANGVRKYAARGERQEHLRRPRPSAPPAGRDPKASIVQPPLPPPGGSAAHQPRPVPLPLVNVTNKVTTVAVNTQFSIAVHMMAGLGHRLGLPTTSAQLASSVNTSASFVRRTLAKLSKAGLVDTATGQGGACRLARHPRAISLLEIYRAVDAPRAFAIHAYAPDARCAVSCNIKSTLEKVLDTTQRSMESSLKDITLADVVRDVNRETFQRGDERQDAKTPRKDKSRTK